MSSGVFYRNIHAREQLDLFLLTAVSTLLAVRFYLYITGYPQVGAGGLHIAHMLWGGLLMLTALVILLSFLGARSMRTAAIIGGAGFGVFIDELGKFITHDNNYFYQPAIGIIYAIFIVLYLTFNFVSRKQQFTSREYQLNALTQMEEAVVHNMDNTEKARVEQLLAKADQNDAITHQLQLFLRNAHVISDGQPGRLRRWFKKCDAVYEAYRERSASNALLNIVFTFEILFFIGSVALLIYRNVDGALELFQNQPDFSLVLALGQIIASAAAASYAAYGIILLRKSRLRALEQFRRATMVNIFLTEFFLFSRIEFGALPGFLVNLLLLACIEYAMYQERRITQKLFA